MIPEKLRKLVIVYGPEINKGEAESLRQIWDGTFNSRGKGRNSTSQLRDRIEAIYNTRPTNYLHLFRELFETGMIGIEIHEVDPCDRTEKRCEVYPFFTESCESGYPDVEFDPQPIVFRGNILKTAREREIVFLKITQGLTNKEISRKLKENGTKIGPSRIANMFNSIFDEIRSYGVKNAYVSNLKYVLESLGEIITPENVDQTFIEAQIQR